MEKGFNEKELADIMSEIESLEREFAAEPVAAAPEEEPSVMAVMQELAETPVEVSVPKTQVEVHDEPEEQKVVAMKPSKHTQAPAALSFKVEGEMTVQMTFEVNGQSVSLQVSQDGLCIETESGAKFSLPVHQQAARKAS